MMKQLKMIFQLKMTIWKSFSNKIYNWTAKMMNLNKKLIKILINFKLNNQVNQNKKIIQTIEKMNGSNFNKIILHCFYKINMKNKITSIKFKKYFLIYL